MRLRHDISRVRQVEDPKAFGRVAVLAGGDSALRAESLQSGAAVLAALQRQGVDARGIDPAEHSLADLPVVFDRAWIALHGAGGEDGTVQGAFDCLGLPYTGSGVAGSAATHDKVQTKRLVQAIGIASADYEVVRTPADLQAALERIGLPLVLKPVTQGAAIGLTVVRDVAELPAALQAAAEVDDRVLVEQYLPGHGYSVFVLQGEALPIVRRDATGDQVPCGLSGQAAAHVVELALAAFEATGAMGWGQVDLRSDATGRPQLLEINTVPVLGEGSPVRLAAQAAGMDFDRFAWRVLETSFARQPAEVR